MGRRGLSIQLILVSLPKIAPWLHCLPCCMDLNNATKFLRLRTGWLYMVGFRSLVYQSVLLAVLFWALDGVLSNCLLPALLNWKCWVLNMRFSAFKAGILPLGCGCKNLYLCVESTFTALSVVCCFTELSTSLLHCTSVQLCMCYTLLRKTLPALQPSFCGLFSLCAWEGKTATPVV